MNLDAIFQPSATDVPYEYDEDFIVSMICRIDSYKFSHPFAYPDEVGGRKIMGMTSYGSARVKSSETIIPAGMQMFAKRYLTQRVTQAHVEAAEAFTVGHFGRKLFAREAWEKVVSKYDGFLPLIIRALPEGTRARGGLPLYSVTVLDEDLFWMSASFETPIQRAIWYPTTIATMDYAIKREIYQMYLTTGADMSLLPFSLHDFGGRGVTSGESAEIGGFAHTINFQGSDTVEGILAANHFYKSPMAAFSVYATEHAVECSFGGGEEDALRYIRKQLSNAVEGGIISIVIDGYDVYREAELLCTTLRDEIIATKAKVVFRPDSGDMQEVVPRLLRMQEMAFGSVTNDKGFRRINTVGVIQGDGVNHLAIRSLLGKIMTMGFSADNVIFGSGGALLQKLDRDTFKFAQKACALLLDDGGWFGIAKNPITDPGKKSMEGVMTTIQSKMTGELSAARLDLGPLDSDFEDQMVLVYHCGRLFNETTLEEIRARCA